MCLLFYARLQSCETRLCIVCLSVRLSTLNYSSPALRNFVKFYVGGYLMNTKESIVSHSHPRVINLTGWAYFLTCCSFSSPAELVFSLTKLIFWQAPAVFSHRLNLFSHRLNLFSHRLNLYSERLNLFSHRLNLFSSPLHQFFSLQPNLFSHGLMFFLTGWTHCLTGWSLQYHRIMIQDWWPGRGRKFLCPVSRHCPPPPRITWRNWGRPWVTDQNSFCANQDPKSTCPGRRQKCLVSEPAYTSGQISVSACRGIGNKEQ